MKIFPSFKKEKIRLFLLLLIFIIPFLIRFIFPLFNSAAYKPQSGDILFQRLYPFCDLVIAIEGISQSVYSHCGVVVKDEYGKWVVVEALGEVKKTPLKQWLAQGTFGKFAVFRLKREYSKYMNAFILQVKSYLGRPYDFKYKLDDSAIYCSELIYHAFANVSGIKLGKVVRLGDMNWQPYKEIIEKYEDGPVPLDRLMITPVNMSKAPQLEKVFDQLS